MANFCCTCKSDCAGLAIVASIIIGIITAFLQFSAVITVTPAFLWVVLGIAVVYLAILLAVSPVIRRSGCVCNNLSVILVGILGAILTSIVLLAITFAATSVIGAIITGALLAFFSLIVTTVACLIKCIIGCANKNDYE